MNDRKRNTWMRVIFLWLYSWWVCLLDKREEAGETDEQEAE